MPGYEIWDYDGRKFRGKRLAPLVEAFWGQRLPLHRHKGLGRRERAKRKFLAFLAFLGVAGLAGSDEGGPAATYLTGGVC